MRAFRIGAAGAALASVVALASAGAALGAATPRCTTPGLVVWLDTQGSGAAGSVYYRLELTNLSGHTCALYGYPGVSAVGLRGRQLGSPASRDRARAPGQVVLAPGATATATLRIVEAGTFEAAACHVVTAAGLRVYPPGATVSKVVPFPFRACSRSGPPFLSVRATVHL
jgi:hypothetical protein